MPVEEAKKTVDQRCDEVVDEEPRLEWLAISDAQKGPSCRKLKTVTQVMFRVIRSEEYWRCPVPQRAGSRGKSAEGR